MAGSSDVNSIGVYGSIDQSSSDNVPGSRSSAAGMVSFTDNSLWLFGGFGMGSTSSIGFLNDVWTYSINSSPSVTSTSSGTSTTTISSSTSTSSFSTSSTSTSTS